MSKYYKIAKKIIFAGSKEKAAEDLMKKMFKKSPFRGLIFIAGGYVRDEVIGLDLKDIDMVVKMKDGGIKAATWLAKKLNIYKKNSNPVIYPKFGTAKIVLRGIKHNGQDLNTMDVEFVHTRTEKYEEGSRKPKTEFGTLRQDVERRDFTVNSLLKDLDTGEILDLTGMGRKDLKEGILRSAIDPNIIFKEDALRMMRLIRFAVKYKWKIPKYMLEATKKNAKNLNSISAERIRDEFSKIMISGQPVRGIKLLRDTGLMKYIADEIEGLIGLDGGKYHDVDTFEHSLRVLEKMKNSSIVQRLSALFHDIGKPTKKSIIDNEVHFYEHEKASGDVVEKILKRLKYPNDIIQAVKKRVESHMRPKDTKKWSPKAIRKLVKDLGPHLDDVLELVQADNLSHHPDFINEHDIPNLKKRIKELNQDVDINKVKLPVDGKEIMELLNVKSGPVIGKVNRFLEDKILEDPKLSKEEAKKLIIQNFR